MTCPAIQSGGQFLGSTLSALDCNGRALGEAGYQALAASGSPIQTILLAMLTLFLVIQGVRLMFGNPFTIGDATMAAVKVGMVLLLATSWPAVRTLFYDTAIRGPAELVEQMGGDTAGFDARLQRVDDGIVALTAWGTGKLDIRAGRTADGTPAASAFTGEAMNEDLGLSLGRTFWLAGTIGTIGLLRLGGGLLVSLLPLFAGFLLFERGRSLAVGWARAWLFLFVASLSANILLMIEMAMLEPWLARMIAERSANLATPSMPIELLVLAAAFTFILLGTMALVARICFAIDPVPFASALVRYISDRVGAVLPQSRDIANVDNFQTVRADRTMAMARALERPDRRSILLTQTDRQGTSTGGQLAIDDPAYAAGRPMQATRSRRRQSLSLRKRDRR